MPIAYLDTDALVKLVLNESGSERVQDAIDGTGRICSSVITYAEARATISRHYFEKGQGLPVKNRAAALDQLTLEHQGVIHDFNALWADVNEVDVTPVIYRVAGGLTVAHPGLRGMDALHLAAALEVQKSLPVLFLTFDDRLRAAATALLGVKSVA